MTVQVLLLNQRGLVLASDSSVWAPVGEGGAVLSGARKVFHLDHPHRLAMAISGVVDLAGMPYESLLTLWGRSLTHVLPTVGDYADDFAHWVAANTSGWAPREDDYYRGILDLYYQDVAAQIATTLADEGLGDAPWDSLDVRSTVDEVIGEALDEISSLPLYRSTPAPNDAAGDSEDEWRLAFCANHADVAVRARDEAFDGLPRTVSGDRALAVTLPALVLARRRHSTEGTVVFSGFGAQEAFPAYASIRLGGIVGGRLLWAPDGGMRLSADSRSGIATFGQDSAITAFITGVSHPLKSVAHRHLEEMTTSIRSIQDEGQGESATRESLDDAIDQVSRESYVWPLLNGIQALPMAALARAAERMLGLQLVHGLRSTGPGRCVAEPFDVVALSLTGVQCQRVESGSGDVLFDNL